MPAEPSPRRIFLTASVLAATAAVTAGCSFPPQPSVRPDDVTLTAVLHRPGDGPNLLSGRMAFGYTGTHFPAHIRFYLDGTPQPRGLIVYTHAEGRWGLDMNWWTTFPITFA